MGHHVFKAIICVGGQCPDTCRTTGFRWCDESAVTNALSHLKTMTEASGTGRIYEVDVLFAR